MKIGKDLMAGLAVLGPEFVPLLYDSSPVVTEYTKKLRQAIEKRQNCFEIVI